MDDRREPRAPARGQERETGPGRDPAPPSPPSLSLPKGGGALRSIDEKLSVNAANGTCDLALPLPFSTTRGGLDGAVALRYSSGAGNSPFGLGWDLTLPSIQRKTGDRLPHYDEDTDDDAASDVFVFSGAEDLVPALRPDEGGGWERDETVAGGVRAERYRPRIEGGFARIERISLDGETGFFWKVTTRDNVVTLFGRTAAARLADPEDTEKAGRVFRWLPEWMYDDKGNCVEFVYKDENTDGVPDVVDEKNRRSGLAPCANKYLKRIRYGNKNPYLPDPGQWFDPPPPVDPGYFYETVFDYGEHDVDAPSPAEVREWPCRFDPFSDGRAGFEIRTWRLCRRVLCFHFFTELNAGPGPAPEPTLVRSVDLRYRHFQFDGAPSRSEEAELLVEVRQTGWKKTAPGAYERRSLPPFELTYHELAWNRTVSTIALEDTVHAPAGVGAGSQWSDLDGVGAPGILTEQAGAWYFKSNLGDGRFARARTIARKPSFSGLATGALQLQDLDADGRKQAVSLAGGLAGYFELGEEPGEDEWLPFRAFERMPGAGLGDPNARFLDLDGDGKPDLLIAEDHLFRWYPSLGTRGYDAPRTAPKPLDEERGPAVVFADGTESIFLADMNGDGLGDIVRVRNGEVCYWPSLGHGRFGAKVTMRDAPFFDHPEHFDPSAIQLADVSGTGAADLIYLGRGGFTAWLNLAGNAWSAAWSIDPFPRTTRLDRVSVLDLLGNGTAALVWSSDLPGNATAPLRYVDLMGGRKPYILSGYRNHLGKETRIEYRSSSHYALRDKREGRPWVTKLPFPVMCVSRTEMRDPVRGSRFVHEYRYRHGFYDHQEREFRGFGMVEETDTETFDRFAASGASNVVDAALHQPPTRTRTWYHTGAFIRGARLLDQFADEYYRHPLHPEHELPDAVIETLLGSDPPLTPDEARQAARACKGMMLRREIYADDGSPAAVHPYATERHNCHVRRLQPMLDNAHAVFLPHASEAITWHTEREPSDPRVTHEINVEIDELGNVIESASIVYPRAAADASLPPEVQAEQGRLRATYTVRRFTNDVKTDAAWRSRLPCEVRTFELTGTLPAAACFTPAEIGAAFLGSASLAFEEEPHAGTAEKRLIQHERTLFARDDDPEAPLLLGGLDSRGLPFEGYKLAFTPPLLAALYGTRVTDAMLSEGDYARSGDARADGRFPADDPDDCWWVPSGRVRYPAQPEQHFFLPDRHVDPRGATTTVRYHSDRHLLIDRVEDALGNATTALAFDFRLLQPISLRDINDNIAEVRFDILGRVAGTALRGKGAEADDFSGFDPDPTPAEIAAFFADPVAQGPGLLRNATSRFLYRFDTLPAVVAAVARETHHQTALAAGSDSELMYSFEYSDGLGQVAMKKAQAEPGPAKRVEVHADGSSTVSTVDTTPLRRWVGSGRTVLDNKGNPVLRYEPYFSVTHDYETAAELVETGVTPVLRYDPIGRLTRTEHPDGTVARVEIGAWRQSTFDQNDTVLTSSWHAARISGVLGPEEASAAQKAALHDETPTVVHFDSLGRPLATVEHNRFRDRTTETLRDEHTLLLATLDIQGHRLALRDPRGNEVLRADYDLLGRAGRTVSMDAGERRFLEDAAGGEIYRWDAKGNLFHTLYDLLHRPTRLDVLTTTAAPRVLRRWAYGTDRTTNRNGRLTRLHDGSGVTESSRFDFKGNLLAASRRFTSDPAAEVDWTDPASVPLQARSFTTAQTWDALNRAISTTSPDGSVTTARYSAAGLLTAVAVAIRGAAPRPFIARIDHDVKGQRERIEQGNGTVTTLAHDETTFRVRRIHTTRASDGAVLQDLHYTHDPVGNITLVRDLAQQTVFFNNQIVPPHNDFTYDAAYRLIAATGREHLGLNAPASRRDEERTGLAHPADGNALQRYRQQYEYDVTGNLVAMAHSSGSGPFVHQWTREFTPAAGNNRLDASRVGPTLESYTYDPHGNLASLPGLPSLEWDVEDRLRGVDLGGGGTALFTYDGEGNRARKVVRRAGGIVEERLYVGLVEIFTRTQGGVTRLQRETLHVMDGARRLALVETRVAGDGGEPAQLIRYQLSNHLGTATLEIDDLARIISFEEYHPFGSTSLQTVDATREVPARRYRYTGKERDEETGFLDHGARYYAPWLARWTAPDPKGTEGGANLYIFVRNNPIRFFDPDGRDVRISVDQRTHTITYSTTVHVFATQAQIRQLRPIAQSAERFFRNPRVETADQTWARLRTSAPTATQRPTYTDPSGTRWRVQFEVTYQLHDIATTPPPHTYDSVTASDQAALGYVTNRAANEQAMQRSFGYRAGDNVLTLASPSGNTGGVTALLSTPHASRPTFGTPQSRMFGQIVWPARFNRDNIREALIHEPGHMLGFDERYDGGGGLASNHAGFDFDLMAAGSSRSEITMHPRHIEEAGSFGVQVANGRDLVDQVLRGNQIDDTGTQGSIPLFGQATPTQVNPAYTSRQTLLRSELMPFFQQQVTGTPPPPPPPVIVPHGLSRPGACIPP